MKYQLVIRDSVSYRIMEKISSTSSQVRIVKSNYLISQRVNKEDYWYYDNNHGIFGINVFNYDTESEIICNHPELFL